MIHMTQDIKRRWADKDEAKNIRNYPNPEDIPQPLKDRLAMEMIVETMGRD